ncbi:hypothetical protein [Flavisphingomonas formosensis]|uniref:hypothetical protein n=1 Tax=Flavisphingomonas formosensis TaxID=861534 RepID=UPI0012F95818|nr:hypothetical protein [Sphingomonas formosensis]
MAKHLILARDSQGDWYKRAQTFLADNGAKPMKMEISDADPASNVFRQALDALASASGEPVTLDPQGALITVTAGLDDGITTSDLLACECKCGATLSCGGGGGGH